MTLRVACATTSRILMMTLIGFGSLEARDHREKPQALITPPTHHKVGQIYTVIYDYDWVWLTGSQGSQGEALGTDHTTNTPQGRSDIYSDI